MRPTPRQKTIGPDETDWRIAGQLARLHVFVAAAVTCYVIDRRCGVEGAESVLGDDCASGMPRDG